MTACKQAYNLKADTNPPPFIIKKKGRSQSWKEYRYVALCGAVSQAIHEALVQNKQLTKVTLCLDNDAVGHKAAARHTLLFLFRPERYVAMMVL